jgi:dihydroorotase
MSTYVIKGATVVDESGSRRADVKVVDGFIDDVADTVKADGTVIDAAGCIVAPGLVDIHTHIREPGREDAETVETSTRAAALGGYTAIVAMPNTQPVIDHASVVRQVERLAQNTSCDVAVSAAITKGQQGKELTEMSELKDNGVRIFTDDGDCVQSSGLMRRAMEYAAMLDVVVADHCEDITLTHAGSMHEGLVSSTLGIGGMPSEAEDLMVMRDIELARMTGARLHLMHVSTKGAVELLRRAKAEGLRITAEVAPHHFALTDEEVRTFDAVYKVAPPLRSDDHREAVKKAVEEGLIDAIATDHAPWAPHFKDRPFEDAPRGMIGLETALAVAITELDLPIDRILALMSWQPARIAGLDVQHGRPVAVGEPANITVIDPEAAWVVEPERFASKSRNTPFAGRKLKGRVLHTFLRGEPTVLDGEATK